MNAIDTTLGAWRELTARGPHAAQVFAVGDIHGRADELSAVLRAIRAEPRTAALRRLIFLGDIIDRGPASLRAVSLVNDSKVLSAVDDVVVLPGNHELMLLDGLANPQMYLADWLDNGGDMVITETQPDPPVRKLADIARIARDAVGETFMGKLTSGPTWHSEGDLLFVHAGVDPLQDIDAFLAKPRLFAPDSNHWAWIRDPFLTWRHGWGGRIIVHGHTPTIRRRASLEAFSAKADQSKSKHRICLDAGAAIVPQIGWAEFGRGAYRINLTTSNGRSVSERAKCRRFESR